MVQGDGRGRRGVFIGFYWFGFLKKCWLFGIIRLYFFYGMSLVFVRFVRVVKSGNIGSTGNAVGVSRML